MRTLLIADDEPGIRALVRMTLQNETYEILEAADGEAALEIARSRHPELIPKGEAFMKKWGVAGIFIGRFFGPLRASVPLVAGIFAMPFWRFQIANFASAFVWAAVLLTLGDVVAKLVRWMWVLS